MVRNSERLNRPGAELPSDGTLQRLNAFALLALLA